MYYKVLKNNKVIDVLDKLIYLKYQPKHNTMVLTDENDAQAILSSDKNSIWHEKSLYKIPVSEPKFDIVELIEVDEYEYRHFKILNGRTPQDIIDDYNLLLIEMGVI